MFFMSERQKAVTVRNEKPVFNVKTGEQIGKVRRLHANLERGYMPDWALEIAAETFSMGGKPPSVPIHRWISTYDSVLAQRQEGWTDEERELIEAKLLSQGDVIVAERPKIAAPYAQYDKHRKIVGKRGIEQVLADITSTYELAGFDLAQAEAYEEQNLNDPKVLEHLRSLAPAPAEAEFLIEA